MRLRLTPNIWNTLLRKVDPGCGLARPERGALGSDQRWSVLVLTRPGGTQADSLPFVEQAGKASASYFLPGSLPVHPPVPAKLLPAHRAANCLHQA